jgi:DNA-binding transcriptional LysR family regulator
MGSRLDNAYHDVVGAWLAQCTPQRAFMSEPLTHLKTLIEAANAGSFSRAAESLGCTASAVSKAVMSLEAAYGVRIFNRSPNGVTLTDEGASVVASYRAISEAESQLRSALGGARRITAGRLRVMLYHAPGRTYIVPHLSRFMAQFPQIQIECSIVEGYVDMERHGVDVAVLTGEPPEVPGLVARRLFQAEMVSCASLHYLKQYGVPKHPRDLAKHRALVLVRGDGELANHWRFHRENDAHDLHVTPHFSINDVNALTRMAIAGAGIVHFPLIGVKPFVDSGELQTILNDWYSPYRPVYLLIAPGRKSNPRVRAFVEFIDELMKADIPHRAPPSWFTQRTETPMVHSIARPVFPPRSR